MQGTRACSSDPVPSVAAARTPWWAHPRPTPPPAPAGDQSEYGGRGNSSSGEFFSAAPNIDHSQDFVKRDLCEWLIWLRQHVGFDGWR
jgi:hypothetical protein